LLRFINVLNSRDRQGLCQVPLTAGLDFFAHLYDIITAMKNYMSLFYVFLAIALISVVNAQTVSPGFPSAVKRQIEIAPTIRPMASDVATQTPDPSKFRISKAGVIDPASARTKIASVQFSGGRILMAWEKYFPDNGYVGEAAIYGEDMSPITAVYYTNETNKSKIGGNAVIALTADTALIAYGDTIDKKGKYVVVNDKGIITKGPVVFCDDLAYFISLTHLPGNKTVLLSYQKKWSNSGRGEFQVINQSGNVIIGPVVFNDTGYTSYIGAAVVDGLIWLNYTSGFSRSKLFDLYGNTVRDAVRYGAKQVGVNKPFITESGKVLLPHIDSESRGMVLELNRDGSIAKAPFSFASNHLTNLSASRLASGNIFVVYSYNAAPVYDSKFTLLDKNGNRIKELADVCGEYEVRGSGHTELKNGKVLLVYGGFKKDPDSQVSKSTTRYKIIDP
jgi:hypothetical protein